MHALLWPFQASGQKRNRASVLASWVAAVPAAAMLTACCLGGWLIPGVPLARMAGNGWLLAMGCLIFLAKTWIVILISRWFASYGFVERRSRLENPRLALKFFALGLAAVLALGWIWTDLPLVYRVTGQVLATAASVTFFTALTILGLKQQRHSLEV